MSEHDTPAEVTQHDLEDEAEALVERYNTATPHHCPELEWFAMHRGKLADQEQFVFETESYVDPDGISALRSCGRGIEYIEAHQTEDGAAVSIHVPVLGELPETEVTSS